VGQLREYNQRAMAGNGRDPSLDAAIHSTLEDLSQYADITVLNPGDGSATVMLNGQTPLLVGDQQYAIGFQMAQPTNPAPTYPNARPLARIVGADGTDITAKATSGKLGSLLDFRNRVLPTYIGSAYQPGELNQMAKNFADGVNAILPAGTPLFSYDAANDVTSAQTIAVDSNMTAAALDANDPGPPAVANGIALKLSGMARPVEFGDMASRVGTALNDATSHSDVQQATVAQARDLRTQLTGVSLDEEATILVQFQRAYEATSKMISVLDQLTQEALNLIQG
jgi:flagellar hook-associated protein 1 FlgK